MLLASGGGSVASRKWLKQSRQIWVPLIAIIGVLLLYVGVLPQCLDRFVGVPFSLKVIISGILLAPLGFAMGMPYPTGLRALADTGREMSRANAIEWAWAMNAASSVLGSVLAIVIAIEFGLNATLTCGAAAYAVALLLNGKLHWRMSAG
jgi:hypothetical protein